MSLFGIVDANIFSIILVEVRGIWIRTKNRKNRSP